MTGIGTLTTFVKSVLFTTSDVYTLVCGDACNATTDTYFRVGYCEYFPVLESTFGFGIACTARTGKYFGR